MTAPDPYADPTVVDARAPRTTHLVVGLVTLVALAAGWWMLLALVALQLALALALGRRWSLPCRLWFEVLRPRLGPGRLEDAAPRRFANGLLLALAVLATGLVAGGEPVAGWLVAAGLAGLGLFTAISGVCVGSRAHRRLFGT